MAQTVSIRQATVKFPAGKVFTTQYGDRRNAVLTLEDGEEIKLWGAPEDPILAALKKGQKVAVIQDQKGWKLLQTPPAEDTQQQQPAPAPSSRVSHTPLTGDEKRAVASYIDQLADLYSYCQRVTANRLVDPEDASGEDLRAISTTLFLQAVKKFNL